MNEVRFPTVLCVCRRLENQVTGGQRSFVDDERSRWRIRGAAHPYLTGGGRAAGRGLLSGASVSIITPRGKPVA